jgi:proteasome lid subunit RPN8/RPN11
MSPTRLEIPGDIYEAMVGHCRAGLPNEACGFLGGNDGKATKFYPLTNEAASPVFYRPAGKEMLEAMNDMDSVGAGLAAIFHSHVASPAYPSPTDVREAHYPDAAYLIVSFEDEDRPSAKAYSIRKADWRDDSGEIVEVELVIS